MFLVGRGDGGLEHDRELAEALGGILVTGLGVQAGEDFGQQQCPAEQFPWVGRRGEHRGSLVVATVPGGEDACSELRVSDQSDGAALIARGPIGAGVVAGHGRIRPGVCVLALAKRDWTSAQLTMFHHCLTKVALSFLYCR